MIVIGKNFTENLKKLQETLSTLDIDAKITVLEDEAFLPDGILSPYEHYIAKQNRENHIERELFYDALPMPEYWEVRDNGRNVGVYHLRREKAKVYFRERKTQNTAIQNTAIQNTEMQNVDMQKQGKETNTAVKTSPMVRIAENGSVISSDTSEKGVVWRVEWQMENGWIYRVDFYNKYGLRYASEFRDSDGNVESRVFYSDDNREVIVEQPGNDVVTLLENGMVKAFFNSHQEYIEHYLAEVIADEKEKKMLFVQDKETLQSLQSTQLDGNEENAGQAWDCALFSNDDLLNQYKNMGGKNGFRFYAIPRHYPKNEARGEALILTNSDEIERVDELTLELTDVTFHIAANTLMSDKLLKLGERENVNLYPGVGEEKLKELWQRCDFYLDINHWGEIREAVNTAHQNNLLIMGFENTLHHKELLGEDCIFSGQEYKKMARRIKDMMKNLERMQETLSKQQGKKEMIWVEIMDSMKAKE